MLRRHHAEVEGLRWQPEGAADLELKNVMSLLSFIQNLSNRVSEDELVDELPEDVLLAVAVAHPGEEHAEDGDGEQGLVQHHLRHHRPAGLLTWFAQGLDPSQKYLILNWEIFFF